MTTDPTPADQLRAVIDVLDDAESYLSALHDAVGRHDHIGADLTCGGCTLNARIGAALVVARRILGTTEQADTVTAPTADRATVLREAADRYTTLADQNEAYDREHGELDETARIQYEAVRDVAAGLRRLADEAQQPTPAVVSEYPTFGDIARTIHTKHPTTEHCEHDGEPWPCRVIRVTTAVYEQPTPAVAESLALDALHRIHAHMVAWRSGGDEWASEWLGEEWTSFPLELRAAAGDTDAAEELATPAVAEETK